MDSEHDKNGDGHRVQTGSGLRRVKPYAQCEVDYGKRRSPLKLNARPPYMDDGLGLLFVVGGPISGSVTKWESIYPYY
jgi:hypothetical protein